MSGLCLNSRPGQPCVLCTKLCRRQISVKSIETSRRRVHITVGGSCLSSRYCSL